MHKRKDKKSGAGRGYCCPHCADSKYPCVTMEKALKVNKRKDGTRLRKV